MNRGAEILSKQIADRGAQRRLADKLGIDQGLLSRIARGVRTPGLATRRILESGCGIPMQLWDEPPGKSESGEHAAPPISSTSNGDPPTGTEPTGTDGSR